MRIVKRESPNFYLDWTAIEGLCLHGTSGPLKPSIDWLCNPQPDNPGAAVSANYVISRAGVIYELVDWRAGKRAWANGRLHNPDLSVRLIRNCFEKGLNPNRRTISIEHEATALQMRGHAPMTDVQFNASTELVITILRELKLPISLQTVTGHYQYDSIDKSTCPGVINIPAYVEVLDLRKDWYK